MFAGYRKQMEKFFEHNPGFSSRIPYTFPFEDYTDVELLSMLQYKMKKFYDSPMVIEDGTNGLYMRIAVRRLGRGRGKDGFGNARALENLFSRIRERQSDRLTKERRDGLRPDDNFINKEDLIGLDPSQAILNCQAWDALQKMTGLRSVKDSVSFMIDLIKTNYDREIKEKPLIEVSLNRVFLGFPGEDRCVLLLGYEDQMIEMFQNVNPGLTRRFQLSDAFHFEDFSDAELREILLLKLKNQDLGASESAISVARLSQSGT